MQVSNVAHPSVRTDDKAKALYAKAQELESVFLAEMLAHAGFGESRESFGGGIGEEQFASFLRTEQAKALAQSGGIGLAELLFRSMTEGETDHE